MFLISGVWHGTGIHFLIWGVLHGAYQVIDGITLKYRRKWNQKLRIDETLQTHKWFQVIINFWMVTVVWIFFRAPSIQDALDLIKRMIFGFDISLSLGNVHIKQNNWHQGIGKNLIQEESIFELCGLGPCDLIILLAGIIFVFCVDILRYKKFGVHHWFDGQNWIFKWTILIFIILFIAVYGLYGGGYHADTFIYANF